MEAITEQEVVCGLAFTKDNYGGEIRKVLERMVRIGTPEIGTHETGTNGTTMYNYVGICWYT